MTKATARAPYQVLVLPFRRMAEGPRFAIFRRRDENWWQAIAGGGHVGELPHEAARREMVEESGLSRDSPFFALKTLCFMPCTHFSAHLDWPEDTYVIPEYCFAVDAGDQEIVLSQEHLSVEWVDFETANQRLKWDSNRTALWELSARVRDGRLLPTKSAVETGGDGA